MDRISIYPVEGHLKDGEAVILDKLQEIIAWINEQEERLKPVVGLETLPGGWISVNDRLPEEKEVCLVYAEGFVLIAHYLGRDYWNHGYYPNRINPSFWMPLPAAPEDV